MRREPSVLKRVRVLRIVAVATVGVAAGVHQGLVGNWVALAGAVGAAAAVVIWGSEARRRGEVVAGAFIALGVLLVWGFRESLVWVSLTGSLALVAAVDLDRLVQRFPVASSPTAQHALFSRHLKALLIIGALSGVSTLSVRAVTLELQLAAVMLLALFTVIVFTRIVQALRSDDRPE